MGSRPWVHEELGSAEWPSMACMSGTTTEPRTNKIDGGSVLEECSGFGISC